MDYEKAFDFAKSIVWLLAILFWWWTTLSAIRSIQKTQKLLDIWTTNFIHETIKMRQANTPEGYEYRRVSQPYYPSDPNAQGKRVEFHGMNQGGKGG